MMMAMTAIKINLIRTKFICPFFCIAAHIYMKIVPVTCKYVYINNVSNSRNSLLIQKVAEIIRVHQNNDTAVSFGVVAARILEAVILSSTEASLTPALLLQALDTCLDTARSDLEICVLCNMTCQQLVKHFSS